MILDLLEKLERNVPQWLIASVVIIVSVFAFLKYQPLHTLCDTQKKAYGQSQSKFLASGYYNTFFEKCLKSNSAGGCEPYFRGFKTLLDSLSVVDDECRAEVANVGLMKNALRSFLVQVPRLAWGSEGPESVHRKTSWLRSRHVRLFCRVKSQYVDLYGRGSFKSLEKHVLKSLPNTEKLRKEELQQRSLFGASCTKYF